MRRVTATALTHALFLLGFSTALTAFAQASEAASTTNLVGTYRELVAEPSAPAAGEHRDVRRDAIEVAGTVHLVRLPGGFRPRPGQRISVTGRRGAAGVIQADTATALEGSAAELAAVDAPAARTDKVLVILATWTQPDAVTPETARSVLFEQGGRWFSQVSGGRYGLTGDVTPWMRVAGPTDGLCFSYSGQVMNQARAQAAASGFDLQQYTRTILYFPASASPDCAGYSGWATQPGSYVWLHGAMTARTAVHEQGHNLGLHHAHAYSCSADDGSFVSFATAGCQLHEYGDSFDAMGSSGYVGHFSLGALSRLGWAPSVIDLSNGGTAQLTPLGSTTAVGVRVSVGPRTYWVERRAASGVDATLPPSATEGVMVRVEERERAAGLSLIDMTPDGDLSSPALRPGGAWRIPDGPWMSVVAGPEGSLSLTVGDAPVVAAAEVAPAAQDQVVALVPVEEAADTLVTEVAVVQDTAAASPAASGRVSGAAQPPARAGQNVGRASVTPARGASFRA
jgi:hypothetical protein